MKNLFKSLLIISTSSLVFSSCYDTMGTKDSVDTLYEISVKPTVTLTNSSAVDFTTISLSGTVDNIENVLEVGFMVADNAEFVSATCYSVDLSTELTTNINGLADNATFYVRGYAVLKDNSIVVSESTTVTTPEAPLFDIDGVYTATEINPEDGSENGKYEITIAFVDGSDTEIELTNLWDGGKTITGTYDAATSTISIPTRQLIYVHETYGDVYLVALSEDGQNAIPELKFSFQSKGGKMNSGIWESQCSAGSFGLSYVNMQHK